MWPWYVAYCVFMALLYVACTVGGVLLLVFADEIARADPTTESAEMQVIGVILGVISVPLMLLFGIAPFLPKTRVGWVLGIIAIAIGMTSPCCMMASIPLLIFWINDKTRKYFGM